MRRSNAPTFRRAQKSNQNLGVASSSLPSNKQKLNNSLSKSTTNQSITNKRTDDYQVFTVVFGDFKPGKKHKEWTDDAILERDCQSIRIFNLEGEK